MFEQVFKNIDDILYEDAGVNTVIRFFNKGETKTLLKGMIGLI